MSKKLAAKNALIEMPVPKAAAPIETSTSSLPRPRTAVGGMAQFVTTQSPLHREVEDLRKVVASFDGARLVKALPATAVQPSVWANRHDASFAEQDFAELKREIKDAGGNVQPIKVRPLNGSTPITAGGALYEIVFGHRRHRACLELDLPVNALIEEIDDQRLFEQMERENRGRKNLSAWEQGAMYLAALERGLYPSQRKLAEAIGVDLALVSKSVALAKLPKEVIGAFASPLDVQFRWAQPLAEAMRRDPVGTVARANEVATQRLSVVMSSSQVLDRLIGAATPSLASMQRVALLVGKKRVGYWADEASGAVKITLGPRTLPAPVLQELLAVLQVFLGKQ